MCVHNPLAWWIFALVSSLLSFGYMYLYLKLNGFIKTILYQMSMVGIVGSLIMIIGEAIILIKKEQTFATCCMIHYSGFLVVFMDVFMTAMISALRYANHCLIFMDFLSLLYIFSDTNEPFLKFLTQNSHLPPNLIQPPLWLHRWHIENRVLVCLLQN